MLPARTKSIARLCWSQHGHTLRVSLSRAESTAAAPKVPSLLLKIKEDLKAAMKARDRERLDVLRALIAETINAAKTSKPIETDLQMLALLRKRIAAGKDAAAQFDAANRKDLFEKEWSQIRIVDDYVSAVPVLGEEKVDEIIKQVIDKFRSGGISVQEGSILKDLFGPSGDLANQPVERRTVARRVREMIHT